MTVVDRLDGPSGRTYAGDGWIYPSVTTVLSLLLPPFLSREWPVQQAIRTAVRNPDLGERELVDLALYDMQDAARRGTDVHEAIEHHLGNVDSSPELDEQGARMLRQFTDWQSVNTLEPWYLESKLVNDTYGYAGTSDFIGKVNGRRFLLDWKTGRTLHRSVVLQLAAYRFAELVLGAHAGGAMPDVDGVGIVHIRPDSCKLITLDCEAEEFADFLAVLKCYTLREAYQERIA